MQNYFSIYLLRIHLIFKLHLMSVFSTHHPQTTGSKLKKNSLEEG